MMKKRQVETGSCCVIPAGTRPYKDKRGKFRPWQKDCIEKLDGSDRAVILAPTGSGKSTVAMARGAICLARDANSKHLISVPQNIITDSFTKEALEEKIDRVSWKGKKLHWCSSSIIGDDKVDKLYDFITSETSATPSMRIRVCTHQALVLVFRRLKKERRLNDLKNVFLTIDEVHHSSSTIIDDEIILENRLGEIVRFFFEKKYRLDMFTATLMRSNYSDIIPSKYTGDYIKYVRFIDEHLQEMTHLKRVSIRFLIGDPEDVIKHIYEESHTSKTINYLPHIASSIMKQYEGKYDILSRLQKSLGPSKVIGVISKTRFRGGSFRSVDLVTERGRDKRKDWFFQNNGKAEEPDTLWALNLCKEGFDWPSASRSNVIGPRGSMVDVIQMLGRLLRDYPGKEQIEFNIILPISGDSNSDLYIDQVRDYLKIMVSSLIVEWQFRHPRFRDLEKQRVVDKIMIKDPTLGREILGVAVDAAINSDGICTERSIRRKLNKFRSKLDRKEKDLLAPVLNQMLMGADSIEFDFPLVNSFFGKTRSWTASFGYKTLRELREALGRRENLTEDKIIKAAINWKKKYGKWPSCCIKGKIPELPGDNWITVDHSLLYGHRGLPGGSSIYKLLVSKKLIVEKSDLTEDKIVEAIINWKKKHGKWPSHYTEGRISELPGDTWLAIDSCLRSGLRGLPGGSSIYRLLVSKKLIVEKSDLTEDKIIKAIINWKKKHGKWPNCYTKGKIPELPGDTWITVDSCLNKGSRSLPGGSSLHKLLVSRGLATEKSDLTEDKIIKAAINWKKKYGKYPTQCDKGKIPEFPESNWGAINSCLRDGCRGLPGGSSIYRLLVSRGLATEKSDLTEDKIIKAAINWKKKYGKRPTCENKGKIPELPGDTWKIINECLNKGSRSLPGGSSLHKLLVSKKLTVKKSDLTEDKIIKAAINWKKKHGRYPTQYDKEKIPELPGDTWKAINSCLRDGRRGLPGGPSLHRLLVSKKLIVEKSDLTKDQIIRAVINWKKKHGKWPSCDNKGKIPEFPGDTWKIINECLNKGYRSLPGGSSLLKLKESIS